VGALVLSAVGGLLAGVLLGGMRESLRVIEGLLVMVPALLATRGNVYGSLGARLATALHQGLIDPTLGSLDARLRRAILAAITNGLLASASAATLAFLVLWAGGASVALLPLVAIAVLSGLFSGVILSLTVVTIAIWGYRRGRDPDTLVGPVVTTAGDVFGLALLLLATRIVLALGVNS